MLKISAKRYTQIFCADFSGGGFNPPTDYGPGLNNVVKIHNSTQHQSAVNLLSVLQWPPNLFLGTKFYPSRGGDEASARSPTASGVAGPGVQVSGPPWAAQWGPCKTYKSSEIFSYREVGVGWARQPLVTNARTPPPEPSNPPSYAATDSGGGVVGDRAASPSTPTRGSGIKGVARNFVLGYKIFLGGIKL